MTNNRWKVSGQWCVKEWARIASLVGVACSSLCFLALPLLALWPLSALGWLHNERLTRGMLVMFLAMYLYGAVRAYRRHGNPKPVSVALIGGLMLMLAAWETAPAAVGWAALAALAVAWYWERRLVKRTNHGHGSCD